MSFFTSLYRMFLYYAHNYVHEYALQMQNRNILLEKCRINPYWCVLNFMIYLSLKQFNNQVPWVIPYLSIMKRKKRRWNSMQNSWYSLAKIICNNATKRSRREPTRNLLLYKKFFWKLKIFINFKYVNYEKTISSYYPSTKSDLALIAMRAKCDD